ncbi:hypothetical protein F4818DRAFT_220602 [Hypoxylon cercidicola]|nr:hypothetical protein F4818DRAFT_220602 [Hypoxylon cercidicola]
MPPPASTAFTASTLLDNRPQTTKEISERARKFQWNPRIPLKAWLRTASTLSQEGQSYLHDGNWGQSYLLYMRYLTLLMDYLPSHPEAKTPEGRKAIASMNNSLPHIATHLENIKPIIQKEYEEWVSEARRKELRQKQQVDRDKSKAPSKYDERASTDPALSSSARLLDAGDHQELAVELAKREIRRRDATRQATRKPGVPQEEEQSRRAAGFWNTWTEELANKQAEDEELFRRQMESTRNKLDGGENDHRDAQPKESRPLPATSKNSSYRYPTIAKSEPVQYEAHKPSARSTSTPQPQLPPRPPKDGLSYELEASLSPVSAPLAPQLPAKEQIYPERTLPNPVTPQELPTLPPKIHEEPPVPAKKQQRLTFKPAAYLENGEPIRSVFLPSQLRHQFLSVASENTRRGLEMCGILCGTAVNNALFVRCLLIPEQKCTSDTCETENEGAMLEYCMNEDLLMLGWIHTHPTQTCFMSSRDLHTQAGYQVMLPESIAIVCAPSVQPSYGIFRLTHPPGLDHILGCTQQSTFHPHSVDNLYTKAQRPTGHVYENENLEFYVKDLRPGSRNSTVQNKKF